jgi:hypothetical protein
MSASCCFSRPGDTRVLSPTTCFKSGPFYFCSKERLVEKRLFLSDREILICGRRPMTHARMRSLDDVFICECFRDEKPCRKRLSPGKVSNFLDSGGTGKLKKKNLQKKKKFMGWASN